MKRLMIGAAALALMAGCNGTGNTSPASPDAPLKELTLRAGDPAKAGDALAAMSLSEGDTSIFSFADSKVEGAKATFTDLTIEGEDGLTAGSLVFEGLDMTDGKANFSRMTFNDILITDVDGEEGEIKLGKIELVNPSPELAAWMAGSLNGQEVPFPSADKIVFDAWSMSGLTGEFNDGDGEGKFVVDKLEIRDMTGDKAARATLSGVKIDVFDPYEDMTVDITLDDMVLTNVNTKFVKALQENMGDEEAMMGAIMAVAYENPMDPGYDAFKLSNLKAAVAGATFTVPSLDAFVERNSAGQPVKFVTKPYSMTLDADADGGEAGAAIIEGLSMVGYESIEMKGESVATYDPDKDIISFASKSNYIELVDGARFSFGGKIEGYNEYSKKTGESFNFAELMAGAEPDPQAMEEAMGALSIHNFEFVITDNSLLDRGFNAYATQIGQDPAEAKNQAASFIGIAPMFAADSGIDMALLTEGANALSKFVASGGTLTIKMDPSTPLNFGDIMESDDPMSTFTKKALGFTATQK